MTYKIEVCNDNEFNEGWLAYVLGLGDDGRSDMFKDGWAMACDTVGLDTVRVIFKAQLALASPQYVVKREPA